MLTIEKLKWQDINLKELDSFFWNSKGWIYAFGFCLICLQFFGLATFFKTAQTPMLPVEFGSTGTQILIKCEFQANFGHTR